MCTSWATYQTKDFYFGRTLDYEISYGDQVVTHRETMGSTCAAVVRSQATMP